MLLQLSHFPPFTPLHPVHPFPPTLPRFSLYPWVIHISSLASTFPILFLTSPCLFSTCHLCYLFCVPIPPLSPSHSPIDNPPCDLHFCGSVPVLVVCLVSADFPKETLQARRGWREVFQIMKGKYLHPRLLYAAKLSFRVEGQIKCFPDKVTLKKFIITKPLLYEMLKGVT